MSHLKKNLMSKSCLFFCAESRLETKFFLKMQIIKVEVTAEIAIQVFFIFYFFMILKFDDFLIKLIKFCLSFRITNKRLASNICLKETDLIKYLTKSHTALSINDFPMYNL